MSDLLERAQSVKRRWAMESLVTALTGEPVPVSRKISSLWANDSEPSMHIYDDSFYDYATGKHGDVITLMREVRRCSFADAIEYLENEADELKLEESTIVKLHKPAFVMPPVDFTWDQKLMHLDGVTDSFMKLLTIEKAVGVVDMGGDLRGVAVVHHDMDWLVSGVKYRHRSRKTAEPGSNFAAALYRPWHYRTEAQGCVLVEGETDCWAWLDASVPTAHVFSLPSGANCWRPEWLAQLEQYQSIHICFDNDQAGRDARDKVSRSVGERAKFVNLPSLYKDVREAVAAGWQPPNL